jgi:hypothetical protein
MRFLTREVLGWALVVLGLYVFYKTYGLLHNGWIVEGSALTVIGFIIFRGGLHLLKVAVAAQVCLRAWEKVEGDGQRPPGRPAAHRPNGFVARPTTSSEHPLLSASSRSPR